MESKRSKESELPRIRQPFVYSYPSGEEMPVDVCCYGTPGGTLVPHPAIERMVKLCCWCRRRCRYGQASVEGSGIVRDDGGLDRFYADPIGFLYVVDGAFGAE